MGKAFSSALPAVGSQLLLQGNVTTYAGEDVVITEMGPSACLCLMTAIIRLCLKILRA